MARKGSKQRRAARALRHRKELDDLIGRKEAEQVLAGTISAGAAVLYLPIDLGERAFHLIDLLKK